ncbi:MAG: hypothetical protein AAFV53_16635 [Myxococcota bacterium]
MLYLILLVACSGGVDAQVKGSASAGCVLADVVSSDVKITLTGEETFGWPDFVEEYRFVFSEDDPREAGAVVCRGTSSEMRQRCEDGLSQIAGIGGQQVVTLRDLLLARIRFDWYVEDGDRGPWELVPDYTFVETDEGCEASAALVFDVSQGG